MPGTTQRRDDVDAVWGCKAIGAEIDRNEQQTLYLLRTKRLPAKKVGKTWLSSRKALREFSASISAA